MTAKIRRKPASELMKTLEFDVAKVTEKYPDDAELFGADYLASRLRYLAMEGITQKAISEACGYNSPGTMLSNMRTGKQVIGDTVSKKLHYVTKGFIQRSRLNSATTEPWNV